MYYLFTFLNPFENDHRPITALLEEGRRPELAAKVSILNWRGFRIYFVLLVIGAIKNYFGEWLIATKVIAIILFS